MTEFFHLYTDGELKTLKEYTQLVQKMHILEQQLQEANEAIMSMVGNGSYRADEIGQAYLDKWGVK